MSAHDYTPAPSDDAPASEWAEWDNEREAREAFMLARIAWCNRGLWSFNRWPGEARARQLADRIIARRTGALVTKHEGVDK